MPISDAINNSEYFELYPHTAVDPKYFPTLPAETDVRKPVDNTDLSHGREVNFWGETYVEKIKIQESRNPKFEGVFAILINHIAASKGYYFTENAIEIDGEPYSISLTPEIPYSATNDKIVYIKLPGQNAHNESWKR